MADDRKCINYGRLGNLLSWALATTQYSFFSNLISFLFEIERIRGTLAWCKNLNCNRMQMRREMLYKICFYKEILFVYRFQKRKISMKKFPIFFSYWKKPLSVLFHKILCWFFALSKFYKKHIPFKNSV